MAEPTFAFHAADETATQRLGRALAAVLVPGTVICLNGPLGAGKTRLVQAVAAALDVPAGTVTSPTFVLINEYRGRLPLYHFDAYRLRDLDEFAQLGPEEYFFASGVCFVEWAERVAEMLPAERLDIDIEVVGENERMFRITGCGGQMQGLVTELAARLT